MFSCGGIKQQMAETLEKKPNSCRRQLLKDENESLSNCEASTVKMNCAKLQALSMTGRETSFQETSKPPSLKHRHFFNQF